MERKPNTIYTLSLSYGKDSLACLGAIEELGLPLDRIVHAEVWATETIPADLPPMVEFKKKADKIIKERYGIEVEHVYAVNKTGGGGYSLTSKCLTQQQTHQNTGNISTDSQSNLAVGVQAGSNKMCLPKLTYEDIFYRTLKPRGGGYELLTVSRRESVNGATENSKEEYSTRIYGFPIQIKGIWCNSMLKMQALNNIRIPLRQLDGRMVQRTQKSFLQARTRRAI